MNGLKQTCLVLSATSYSMKEKDTDKIISGLTVFYLPTDNLNTVEDEQAIARGEIKKGLQPSKVILPYEKKHKIVNAPGMYSLTLQMVSRQLRTEVQPVDIEFIGEVELAQPKVTK